MCTKAVVILAGVAACILPAMARMVDEDSPYSIDLRENPWSANAVCDIIFDGNLTMTPFGANREMPEFSDSDKFAMYLKDDGYSTNLYVVAAVEGGATQKAYSTTNYCLNVSGETLAGTPHHITIYALRSVTTYEDMFPGISVNMMMGFVVYIDGKPVECRDDDYYGRLPQALLDSAQRERFNQAAMAFIRKKMLFVSPLRSGYGEESSNLSEIGFFGVGAVDGFSVGSDSSAMPTPEKVVAGNVLLGSSQTNNLALADLTAPKGSGLDDATYRKLFDRLEFRPLGGRGAYVVEAKLTGEAASSVTNDVDAGMRRLDLAAMESGALTLEKATPGIFYRVIRGAKVDGIDKSGEWAVVDKDGNVDLEIPPGGVGDTSGFFRLEATPDGALQGG